MGRVRVGLAVLALVGLAAPARGAVDLTGKWQFAGTTFVDLSQTGTTVSFTADGVAYTATLDTDGKLAGTGVGPCTVVLNGVVHPNGNTVDLRFLTVTPPACTALPPFPILVSGATIHRCTCFDGNTTDGDGCSAGCRV